MQYLEPSGYSFWLNAAPGENPLFEAWLNRLQSASGSPLFIPHITLLGQVHCQDPGLLKKCVREVCQTGRRFEIRFNKAAGRDDYFKSCFLEVENSDFPAQLRNQLKQSIPWVLDSVYHPHLSLYYGSAGNSGSLIEEAVQSLKKAVFRVTRISIVKTEGRVEDWRQESTCDLL